jgi:dipeptidyl aminopeptidase/acylaminoacyl peptidase
MSPFWYADKIKDPILLMHGEMDDNTGTFPINSERLYAALKGHGATGALVMLPNEAHGYAARETLLPRDRRAAQLVRQVREERGRQEHDRRRAHDDLRHRAAHRDRHLVGRRA